MASLPRLHGLFFLLNAVVSAAPAHELLTKAEAAPVKIMAVGDSITAGADFFSSYRYPLWEKLFSAGYLVEFVGTQSAETRVGPLLHEGYGGKNTEYLATTVPANFRENPADVVLLHSGHNHFSEEKPVVGILAATKMLIAEFRELNPRVTVLLAKVIPAGKLPKYAYIPELNRGLADVAAELDQQGQRVVLVDQASSFDWSKDTVTDLVHPNASGAEKMAEVWFQALKNILPPPRRAFAPRKVTFKTVRDSSLDLHVFEPEQNSQAREMCEKRPAIVFFFGGGWTHGTPIQFYPECAHFSERGFVAISVDYRVAATHRTTPFESAKDARDALTWVRQHAAELGVESGKIVLAGASAGGHLAVVTALNSRKSAAPAALLLLYPILDTSPDGFGHALFGDRFAELSPLHLLLNKKKALPPTIILSGDADSAVPVKKVRAFQAAAEKLGSRCDVVIFPAGAHPLYSYRTGGEPLRSDVLAEADRFLQSLDLMPNAVH